MYTLHKRISLPLSKTHIGKDEQVFQPFRLKAKSKLQKTPSTIILILDFKLNSIVNGQISDSDKFN